MAAAPSLSPHALHVRRLRLHGPAAQLARVQPGLTAAWAQAAWPIVDDDEVLLLRRVRVSAPAASLAQEAAAATRALAARAADPWSPGAAQAEALRFASRADYVAWRLLQRLAAPAVLPADDVAGLLIDAAPALPAVWWRLRETGGAPVLQALWQALAGPAAEQVLAAVAVATGWMPALRPGPAVQAADEPTRRTVAALLPPPATLQAAFGRPAPQASDPRARLGALLALWVHAPAQLGAAQAPALLQAVAQQMVAADGGPPARTSDARRHEAQPQPTPGQAVPPPASPGAAGEPRAVGRIAAQPGEARDEATPTSAAARAPGVTEALSIAGRAAPAERAAFVTRDGGLFWLFSVLALPPLQRRLSTCDEPQAGWREWVRLVRALGADPDDAWWAFAAQRCQLEGDGAGPASAVRRLHWPPAVADALMAAAAPRFGDAALRATLGARPARVVADEARVDVHFRLADADIDVRRRGLDVDPGWLPWLGCVLRWHFGSALAPQGDLPR